MVFIGFRAKNVPVLPWGCIAVKISPFVTSSQKKGKKKGILYIKNEIEFTEDFICLLLISIKNSFIK